MFTRNDDHKPSTGISNYAWEKCGHTTNDEGVSANRSRMQHSMVLRDIPHSIYNLVAPLTLRPAAGNGCKYADLRSHDRILTSQKIKKICWNLASAGVVVHLIIFIIWKISF